MKNSNSLFLYPTISLTTCSFIFSLCAFLNASSDDDVIIYELHDQSPKLVSPQQKADPKPNVSPSVFEPQMRSHEILMLSASVLEGKGTLLRWNHEGESYVAYSNIDFRELTGVGSFSNNELSYSLILSCSAVENDADWASIPEEIKSTFSTQSGSQSMYWSPAETPDDAVAPIEVLHEFYAKNHMALQKKQLARGKTAQEKSKQAKRPHVIRIWPGNETTTIH